MIDEIATDLKASLLDELEASLNGDVKQGLIDAVTSEAPMDTGELRQSVEVDDWRLDGTTFVTTVRATAPQALWTDEGTGVYGPTGSRIYPRQATALVFFWKQAGETVAFRSVAGQPAQHWFNEPMPRYFDFALESLR